MVPAVAVVLACAALGLATLWYTNVYDDYEMHRSRSPMAHVKRVKTPTLLVHGLLDLDAPPQQSIEFYQALKHFRVPSQLVLYPREPHGFEERDHQIDLYCRIGEWVERYLVD
jgi:dipeptidyl aminopeptidase/acylaminoacyl peptidase